MTLALERCDFNATKALLERGAEPDLADPVGATPLHIASLKGNKDAVQLLLNAGADINRVNQDGLTPLQYATVWGRTDIVNLLRENGGI